MKSNKPSIKEVFRYYYNNVLTKGTVFKVALLFFISLLFILILSICLNIATGGTVWENGWTTLLHLLDPGVISGDDAPGIYLAIMLVATLGGMVLFGTLIGIINEGITTRLANINSADYKIIEKDHIIIIGYNEELYYVLKEFADYNSERKSAGQKPHSIVILDDTHSAEEMSGLIEANLGKHPGTRIICRGGNSLNPQVLDKCNAYQAKSVIINTQNDYQTLKWIINISNLLGKSTKPAVTTIIKELKNVLAAEYAGGDDINILFIDDLINHILSLSCHKSGILDIVYDLMDFRDIQIVVYGNELFTGCKLIDIDNAFENATVIGYFDAEDNVRLMPGLFDKEVAEGEKLIFLADNEYAIQNELKKFDKDPFKSYKLTLSQKNNMSENLSEEPQTVLILRFSRTIEALVEDQFSILPKGSRIYVACSNVYAKYIKLLQIGYGNQGLETIDLKGINYYSIEALLNNIKPDKCIILSDYMEPSGSAADEGGAVYKDVEKEDEEVLLAALFLKDIARRKNLSLDIVAELQKASSDALVANMKDDCDYINVGKIMSHILTQTVNDPMVFQVLKAMFCSMDFSLQIYDAASFVNTDETSEYDARDLNILFNSQRKKLIGIKKGSISYLNPFKNKKWTFSQNDSVIVIEQR